MEGVSSQGFTISRSQVILDHPIKTLGIHKIRIALHPEVSVYAQVNIALTEEEAKTQEIAHTASPSLEA